jgi:L-ascorbate metabolism protein UlaG (beta-lactamase superfamily)
VDANEALSDHFDGRHFFNPGAPSDRTLGEFLRWQASGKRQVWPRWVEDTAFPVPPASVPPDELGVTFVNHSTFLLRLGGVNVLTDPIWSERASPLGIAGPRRVRRPGLPFDRLPPIHLVLVSHNHYDHMDLPTLRRLQSRFRPQLLTSLGNRTYLARKGLGRVAELDWWQSYRFGPELEVTLTPAQHFSARGPFDRNRTLWGGFFLATARHRVYFAADTGYCEHFNQVRDRLGPVDVALLPIGAYAPRWFMRRAHLNPEEAVQAHRDLATPLSIAMHFGTFQLTDEAIDEPVRELEIARLRERVPPERFRVLGFGETLVLPASH